MSKLKIGIIREGKTPPDTRVAFTPEQCKVVSEKFNIDLCVQSSKNRCYKDSEYLSKGINVVENVENCDVLIGIKEVKIEDLVAQKTYFFFSHTIKQQAHNRLLLQNVLKNKIKLIDYETIVNEHGERLIAFGRFAGIVGAHNTIRAWMLRNKNFDLKPMHQCFDMAEALKLYSALPFSNERIVLTGSGRVSSGAKEILEAMKIKQVDVQSFLNEKFNEPVFVQLEPEDYVERKTDKHFSKKEYYSNPELYNNTFKRFLPFTDILINGIYYDNRAPRFFEIEDLKTNSALQVIGDITCDMMPHSSIPCTMHTSTIAEPFWSFDIHKNSFCNDAFIESNITMMTIDNLPNELPRDASEAFGSMFIHKVLPNLFNGDLNGILSHATIAENGKLCEKYSYLENFVQSN